MCEVGLTFTWQFFKLMEVWPCCVLYTAASLLVTWKVLGLDGGRGTAGVHNDPGQKCFALSCLATSSWNAWGHSVGAGDQKREGRMFYCLSSLPFRGFWQKGLVFMLLVSPAEGIYGRNVWSEAVSSYCDVTFECKCVTFEPGVSNKYFLD